METKHIEMLFIVMFGVCFGFMGSVMLRSIPPSGVKIILHEGMLNFLPRAGIVCLTFFLSALAFIFSLKFSSNISSHSLVLDFLNVLIIIVFSASPWACYHISRIIFKPYIGDLYVWDSVIKNVDVIFILLYGSTLGILILIRKLFIGIIKYQD